MTGAEAPPNRLYFGDCLEVMREDIADESVDLIYLDPPFNSKRLYNAFIGGAQWVAFDDTWRWHEAIDDFHDVASDPKLAGLMEGLRLMLGKTPRLAYLSYMANRLRECRRVLKPTGSIYLHCDPTMSHYLKTVMDGLFGNKNFINEIIWHYQTGGAGKRWFAKKHDVILAYGKTDRYTFLPDDIRVPRAEKSLRRAANPAGARISANDTHKYPMDVWTDIQALNPMSKERLGYPTQKPGDLLDRIIRASSHTDDTILDPFCGCGTTVHVAQRLFRQWIGIDICVKACKVIQNRLENHFDTAWSDVEFIGMPRTLDHAKTLADLDKFRFEMWAASLVDGMSPNTKQRGDGGIDGSGRLAIRKGHFIDMVSQVKGGSTKPADVQAFNGARQQAGADLGIFTCFEDRVTTGMRNAAVNTGRFMDSPVIQIYTVEDYFREKVPNLPVALAA